MPKATTRALSGHAAALQMRLTLPSYHEPDARSLAYHEPWPAEQPGRCLPTRSQRHSLLPTASSGAPTGAHSFGVKWIFHERFMRAAGVHSVRLVPQRATLYPDPRGTELAASSSAELAPFARPEAETAVADDTCAAKGAAPIPRCERRCGLSEPLLLVCGAAEGFLMALDDARSDAYAAERLLGQPPLARYAFGEHGILCSACELQCSQVSDCA